MNRITLASQIQDFLQSNLFLSRPLTKVRLACIPRILINRVTKLKSLSTRSYQKARVNTTRSSLIWEKAWLTFAILSNLLNKQDTRTRTEMCSLRDCQRLWCRTKGWAQNLRQLSGTVYKVATHTSSWISFRRRLMKKKSTSFSLQILQAPYLLFTIPPPLPKKTLFSPIRTKRRRRR